MTLLLLGAAGAAFVVVRARHPTHHRPPVPRPRPLPAIVSLVPAVTVVRGARVALPFPKTGQAAVFVSGVGFVGSTPGQVPEPIGSVTKVMTALVILGDHPLTGSENGPTFTMTAADHAAWIAAVANNESNLEVVAGEKLTERQLIEAMMIPSADNIADYLARWDAGSIARFAAKMNARASALGLTHTHYVDASGLDPGSQSTAIDQAYLAEFAMENSVLAGIVAERTAVFPVEGTVGNFNPALGYDGIIGLKSGFTGQAQACLVTVAPRRVGSHVVLVVSAAMQQPGGLVAAGDTDIALLGAATSALRSVAVVTPSQKVGETVAGWTPDPPAVVAPRIVPTVVAWPGLVIEAELTREVPAGLAKRGWPTGSVVGTIDVWTRFGVQFRLPVELSGALRAGPPGYSQSSSKSAG